MDFELFKSLIIAVLLSSLIGLEREKQLQAAGLRGLGFRTFGLIGFLGALGYYFNGTLFLIISATVMALMITSYLFGLKRGNVGMTTEIAGILVYLVGVLTTMGQTTLAVVITLMLLGALYFRPFLHDLAKKVQSVELVATMQFMIVAFVVLPLLPNEAMGPYDFFNPYLVWLMVVFISGISFLSYVLIKAFGGQRGIVFSGFLAGFISSTALAFSFSERSKKDKTRVNPYVLAMVIAGTAMFFRVIIEVAVVNKNLLMPLLMPMLLMAAIGLFGALYFYLKKDEAMKKIEEEVQNVSSPFALWPAVKFGVLFALILLASKAGAEFFGDKGIYVASFFSGLLDVDAITLSVAGLEKSGDVSQEVAVRAITLAAMMNTLSKMGIFLLFGGRAVAGRVSLVFGLMVCAGAVSLFL